MDRLNTQTLITNFNAPAPIYSSSGHYEIKVPQSTVMVVKPVSYEFRVAEFVNEKDEIQRVGLQVATFEHDNYGVRQLVQDWTDVERVKVLIKL